MKMKMKLILMKIAPFPKKIQKMRKIIRSNIILIIQQLRIVIVIHRVLMKI